MPINRSRQVVSQNRRARFEYELSDTWEAGLILSGSEVMSLRRHGANLDDAWVGFVNDGRLLVTWPFGTSSQEMAADVQQLFEAQAARS